MEPAIRGGRSIACASDLRVVPGGAHVTPEQFGEWVRLIVQPVVKEPAAVFVGVGRAGRGTALLVLNVAPTDRGHAIGRDGAVIWALRTLVAAAGARCGSRITLELSDEIERR
jgi:predicted RNA-binding protein YlqC (UPF0109 family)